MMLTSALQPIGLQRGDDPQLVVLVRHFSVSQRSVLTAVVPRLTQPSIPTGSVNEDQLQLGKQWQVWFTFIPFVDKHMGVQVKL